MPLQFVLLAEFLEKLYFVIMHENHKKHIYIYMTIQWKYYLSVLIL